MNCKNKSNHYAGAIPGFDRIPKTVLGAIAMSYASNGGDDLDVGGDRLLAEWRILFENGIVEQKPPKDLWRECDSYEETVS